MSDVNAHDFTEISEAADVFDLYAGAAAGAKSGMEVELCFFNPDQNDLPVMDQDQNLSLKRAALAALPEDGKWVHNEPTSEVLEIASQAYDFSNMRAALDEMRQKISVLCAQAARLGLKRSYFQEFPEKSADDLLSRIMDVERYQVMYAPYRADMAECVRYFAVCKSNQVSVSPRDMDHMLEGVRRLYVLAPLLFLLTDNSGGFLEGQRFSGHAGMYLRHRGLRGGHGGFVPYAFTAASGEEFVSRHIDHVMNNPLFMYYDHDGRLVKVPSGDWSVTFNSLKEQGLNTASNYYLAQSVLWPDVKIAALTANDGQVYGHRYEARMFGVGNHQHQSAYLLTSALAFHEDFARGVDALLSRYGFDLSHNSYATLMRVRSAYHAARNHNGRFFDIPYGRGIMAEFARELAELIEDMALDINMQDAVNPLITICRTGCTDGRINRTVFPNLSGMLRQQHDYDPAIFTNPNLCARDIFARQLKYADPCSCAA
ncbi:MAG: hypothetical protein ACLFP8_03685 [Alphaproteobacteria bacterium]